MNTSMSRKVFLSRNQFSSKNKRDHGRNVHPYMKPQFWADPSQWFWENDGYTESAKAYYRAQIATLVSDRHNQIRIENSQI